jgi:hypothetical protein
MLWACLSGQAERPAGQPEQLGPGCYVWPRPGPTVHAPLVLGPSQEESVGLHGAV